ncbi:MAG: hypothetical protein A2293_00740 [Elusimicrobia bacterium RIFOXYB2_FULL_49_7]|nr:MAG: hypothetical protein A2293_00740 [Elusimicrobia bacterium RIFOXYB2_FULL_49_7]
MRTAILSVFLLALLNGKVPARPVLLDSVFLDGTLSVTDAPNLFPIPVGTTFDDNDTTRLFDLFRSRYETAAAASCGFIFTLETYPPDPHARLRIRICEGPFVNTLRFEGISLIQPESISVLLFHRPGGPFNPDSLPGDILRLTAYYQAQGYSAQIEAESEGARQKNLLFRVVETLSAQRYHIQGNRAFSENEIQALLRGDDTGLNRLKQAYWEAGYFSAGFEITQGEAGIFQLKIDEGGQARFKALHLDGPSRVPTDTLLYYAEFRVNAPFSMTRLKTMMDAMLQCYAERGFPFAEIHPHPFTCSPDMDVTLTLQENGRYLFGQLIPDDLTVTRKESMRRLSGFREGALFKESELQRMEDQLFRSGLFESVQPLWVSLREGRRILDVHTTVVEGPANSAEGILGYASKKEEHGGFSGFFSLSMNNLYGTCRKLKLDYLKEKPVTEGKVAYQEPWLLNTRIQGDLSLAFRIEEPAYSLWEAEARITLPFGEDERVRYFMGASRSSHAFPSDKDSLAVSEQITSTHAGVSADFRDFPDNPRRGFYADVPVYYCYKEGGGGAWNEIKLEPSGEKYIYLTGRHILFLGGLWRTLWSADDTLSRAELFSLGGSRTLRGYREGQFTGRSVLSGRMEYRFITGVRSRVILFLDAGGVSDDPFFRDFHFPEKLLFGYGSGLTLSSRTGQIGVEIGFGRGDRLADGKIHLLLRNRF